MAAIFTYDNTSPGFISNTSTSCTSPLARTFTVGDSFTVQDVNLGFNAAHTYRGDIQVTLRHPDGTSVRVISSSGGDSQAGYDVLLDSSSGNSLNDGNADNTASPLYDRTAAPSNSLASFNGKASNGIWTLEVCDTFNGDDGTFNSAQLILNDAAPPIDASLPTGDRPFSLRYSAETTGNIEATGNAVLTCDISLAACRSALSAGTAGNNNAGLAMQMIDIDSDGATFNSSSAQLMIPPNANVLFAGLYWGGTSDGATTAAPDASKRNEALLATPSSGYQTITADTFTSIDNSGTTGWDVYNSFADVTGLVQGGGSGSYTLANVQTSTGTGFTYPNAGWSLVVVYEDPTEPRRSLTVFDGYQFTGFGSSITNTLSGLRTPPTSGFEVFMGAVAGDGEIDSTGDFLAINGTRVSDALNASTNFFNGTISKFGSHITTRTPNDPFNLVIDIDYLNLTSWNQANNAIPTNATSIDVTLGTQGDGIWPMAYFFGVEVFEPNLVTQFEKTTPQTTYANGDTIPYTISVTNTGNDNSTNTISTDAIPAGTTFVPGSLKIGGVAKTDGAGDDEAEFDGNNVIFRIGAGANATQGGQVNINDTVTMTFDVTVTAAPGDLICNQATIDYEGQTSGNAGSGNSDDPNTPTFGDCTEVTTTASAAKDYGDAPDTYGTTEASGGASHTIVPGLHLGTAPDSESDAETPLDGSGDGSEDDGITLATLTEGDTSYSIPAGNITATGTGTLHAWLDFDKSGTFEPGEYTSVAVTTGTPAGDLTWNSITAGAVGETYARFRLASDTSIDANTPGGAASDGEVEDYVVAIAAPSNADLLVVERITAINRGQVNEQLFNTTFEDVTTGVANAADNYANWPNPIDTTSGISDYLAGAINGDLNVGDEVEYTIYFISSGTKPITNVRICDMVPPNTTYVAGSMALLYNGTTTTLSDTNTDSDGGEFVSAPTVPTTPCPEPTNDQGAVIVSIAESPTTIPNATAPGIPADAYGYIRFRVTVD
ncbi:MAG: proprotein convertase P-domain-containing protein [Cyanobacteria bacterium J06634_5]